MRTPFAIVGLIFALISLSSLVGCAGSAGSPTEPSGTATLAPSTPNTFLGSVSLPGGGTGTLMVRVAATLDVMPSGSLGLLGMLFEFLSPSLSAQSSAASGVLTLTDGAPVTLTGTHNAGVFQLSAGGGYGANVSVANGALSGMVSTPSGSAAVTPIGFPAAAPPTSAAAGLYSGSYELNVDGFYKHHITATGVEVRSCSMRVKVTGSVTVRVYMPTDLSNTWAAHVLDTYREVHNIDPNCSTTSGPYERVITPPGALGYDYIGAPSTIQSARVERFTNSVGTGVRTHTFSGSVASGAVEARMSKSFLFTAPDTSPGGTWTHTEGYPTTEATFTLRK